MTALDHLDPIPHIPEAVWIYNSNIIIKYVIPNYSKTSVLDHSVFSFFYLFIPCVQWADYDYLMKMELCS